MASSDPSTAVVVTGLGCVTPIGLDVPSAWRALLAGESGAAPVASFDTSAFRTTVGCEVKGFAPPAWTRQPADIVDRASDLALAATREALASAGLEGTSGVDAATLERAALCIGTTMGAPNFLDALDAPSEEDGEDGGEFPWGQVITRSASSITENLAAEIGVGGPQVSLPAACSAGNYAIGFALDLIRHGETDVAIAGGAEAFSQSAYAGFNRLAALSPDACRPFDQDRKGLLLGEGAGVLVLESESHARARGAPVLARVLGYGLSCDAHHITGPHAEGAGAVACMKKAFEDAAIDKSKVDWICCHGTGTRQNDRIESMAIRKALGEHADETPVSSLKALTGHMLGAASAFEAISCVLALREGVLPPTWNLQVLDPECDLDVIPNEPRQTPPDLVLNNSYAFGGNNACLALGRI
jgi:3-oxoacyl-[acyl-carrier-protein] synthase II